jgi:hypothetical protein
MTSQGGGKGRGLWMTSGDRTPWHKEGVKGAKPLVVALSTTPHAAGRLSDCSFAILRQGGDDPLHDVRFFLVREVKISRVPFPSSFVPDRP